MYTMLQAENAMDPEEKRFIEWEKKLIQLLGAPLEGDEEDLAYSLFADGATPEEARDEIHAQ